MTSMWLRMIERWMHVPPQKEEEIVKKILKENERQREANELENKKNNGYSKKTFQTVFPLDFLNIIDLNEY